MVLIHELIATAAADTPDRLAIVIPDGPKVTFAELDGQIRARAAWVAARTRRGDRIAVIADNGLEFAQLYYGVPRAGRILALINQRLSAAERRAQLELIAPKVVVGDRRYLAELPDIGVECIPFGHPRWAEPTAPASGPVDPEVRPDDPAWLLFTSGSTGAPKGVLHSHRSLTTAVWGTVAGRSVRPGGVYLLPFPMCHIAGYNMLVHHAVGSAVLPMSSYCPAEFVRAVNEFGVTSCSLAPTMLHALLAHLEQTGEQMPTLREIAYGSAAIPADLLRRAIERLGVGFHQGYGMTETGGNITFLGPDEHRAGLLSTAGRPHPDVEIRIADDGEILVRGDQVAPARWPDMTPMTSDGWLPTGDIGRIDDDGRLVVTDRLKDIIITGGENVSSREVEDVLSAHPSVDHVAVVGVPDSYWGEAICAVVEPAAGAAPDAEELKEYVGQHLARFK